MKPTIKKSGLQKVFAAGIGTAAVGFTAAVIGYNHSFTAGSIAAAVAVAGLTTSALTNEL